MLENHEKFVRGQDRFGRGTKAQEVRQVYEMLQNHMNEKKNTMPLL